ncbi:MAG: hypothetical protein Fur0037_13650 [Planctomycetota bacterium]
MARPDRERLRAAFGIGRPGGAGTGAGGLRAFLRRRSLAFAPAARGEVALPAGEEVEGPDGRFWRRILRYPETYRHGALDLGRARACDPERLRPVRGELPGFVLERCSFLDTETTGLSGGAGTVVFNCGIGWFEPGGFVLEQTFLRSFDEERAMLRHVEWRIRQRPILVTYVGKSFDRHRLAARMAVHRISDRAVLAETHLDLYFLARRAFGRDLPDCRLRTVERERLGFERTDDLPGSEAPAAFLDWIRDRTGPVDRVLEHNRLDVLSLAVLLALLGAPDLPR